LGASLFVLGLWTLSCLLKARALAMVALLASKVDADEEVEPSDNVFFDRNFAHELLMRFNFLRVNIYNLLQLR